MSVKDLTILGCSSQVPTRNRNQGGYLLRFMDEGWLFDPGEGTQRQFIYAGVTPSTVTRIFISHFHGDHCLGLPSMIMRLNLDNITHVLHIYYPAKDHVFLERLIDCTIYRKRIKIKLHPIDRYGVVEETDKYKISTHKLDHRVETFGWRITEKSKKRFDKEKVNKLGLKGKEFKDFLDNGYTKINDVHYNIADYTYDTDEVTFAYVADTRWCAGAIECAHNARLLLCESTYMEADKHLAYDHCHLTTKQAAEIAMIAKAKQLVITHFSPRYLNIKSLQEEAQETFHNTIAAKDGLRIDFKD
jgi:ribonuclease Z